MPRTKPIPETEREIGHRLRQWRELLRLPQVFVARMIGVDSTYLASIEHGRTPLQYRYAYPLFTVGKLSPHWLATGMAGVDQPLGTLPPPDLANEPKVLFSHVYHERLVASPPEEIKFPSGNMGREIARFWLERRVAEWVTEVDAKHLNAMVNAICSFAETFLVNRLSPVEEVEARRQHLQDLRAFYIARESALLKSQLQYNVEPLQSCNPVKDHLPQLIDRVRRAADLRGKKAELARFLSVPPQRVNDWLSGKTSPSGETTLRLLEWVTKEEVQQQTETRKVSQPPAGQRPKEKVINENPKSGPKSR